MRGSRPWLTIDEVGDAAGSVLDEVERAVVGKRDALELVLLGLLADGNVLIEDYPGLAKTLAARSFAQATELGFSRIQFTPDLMPSDVTGSSIFNQRSADFEFRPGPIFTNLLLADEINRAPPKTQAALLEAMQERQVTIEGTTHPLDRPFIVLATQNPIEYEGTYPLPEAQLDRFLLRIGIGYPTREDEWRMLERRVERAARRRRARAGRRPGRRCSRCSARSRASTSRRRIGRYMVDLVAATRDELARPGRREPARDARAAQAVARRGRRSPGRDFVTPEDVKAVAVPALAHRLTLRPELWVQRIRGEDIVREVLDTVPTPPAEDVRARAAVVRA